MMILDSGLLFVPLCIVAYQFKKTPSRVHGVKLCLLRGHYVTIPSCFNV